MDVKGVENAQRQNLKGKTNDRHDRASQMEAYFQEAKERVNA